MFIQLGTASGYNMGTHGVYAIAQVGEPWFWAYSKCWAWASSSVAF